MGRGRQLLCAYARSARNRGSAKMTAIKTKRDRMAETRRLLWPHLDESVCPPGVSPMTGSVFIVGALPAKLIESPLALISCAPGVAYEM